MENLFGTLLLIFASLYASIGLGSQVLKNKRTQFFGWSTPLFILIWITYGVGSIYSFLIRDFYILIPYGIGMVFLVLITIQFFKYKNKSPQE